MPVLAVHDVVVALCIAMVGAWLADGHFFAGLDDIQKAFLAGSLLTPIAFFPTFHLYSYHLIFSRRHHLSGLAKAFALNLLAIGVFILAYRMSSILSSNLLILLGHWPLCGNSGGQPFFQR